MKKNVTALLFAAAMIATPSVWAEDKIADVTDMQALRAAVRSDKKAFVASTLKLTPAEAKRFWPVYDNYQRVLDSANHARGKGRALPAARIENPRRPILRYSRQHSVGEVATRAGK